MAYNHEWPYTDPDRFNTDWEINTVKDLVNIVKNWIAMNSIKYSDPIEWDITRQYQANTVVIDEHDGTAYLSTKPVPVNIAIDNTDYWTPIFNYDAVIQHLRSQIATNERKSQTATANRAAGDLVWLDGDLAEVISDMTAGDRYVEGSNFNYVTLESFIKSIKEQLHSDIERLSSDLSAEVTAREEADTTLGELITGEVTAREGYIVYNPSDLAGAGSNIGLKEGVYNVEENTTINAQLVVPKGAIINIAAGVTLTINGSITAGRYQIFDGGGSIVVDSRLQPFGYPEWFNNNVQKCINTFQETVLGAGDYNINGNITINKDNKVLRGVGFSGLTGRGFNGSRLVFNSGRLVIGTPNATTIADFPRHINVKDLEIITLSNPDDIITMCGNVNGVFENLKLSSSSATNGIMFYNSVTTKLNNIYVQALPVKNGAFFAYRFTDVYGGTVGERSASVWITNSIFNDTRSTNEMGFGFWLEGHISDVFIDHCEVVRGYNGVTLKNLSNEAVDIRITNCDFDQLYGHGLEISGTGNTNAGVTFDGNYIALQSITTNALIYLESNVPCTMNGVQLIGTNASQIAIQSPVSPSLIGNGIVKGLTTPINVAGTTNMLFKYLKNGALV